MLHSEGSELLAQINDGQFGVFDNQSSLECDTRSNHYSFNEECPSCSCFSITEMAKQDFAIADCNHNIPQTCGSTSLSSYGSHASSFGCPLNDLPSKNRFVAVDAIDTGQTLERGMAANHLEHEDFFPHIGTKSSCVECGSSGSMFQMSLAEHTPSSSLTSEIHGSIDEKVEIVSPGAEDAKQSIKTSSLSMLDADPHIWRPPEPEEIETDVGSVANYDDDDDECDDGISGIKLSSSRGLDEEKGISYSHKEERKRLLMEVMNGQFKITVSRCLASAGISVSGHDVNENWLDILTPLSWKAALLVKPDDSEGRAMDPASYLKVKCIASGSRSQSQVIKGLVFKKSAAHKHMPTKFKNPRLLLLKGSLGHSASGLSSFESMGREKDHLMSIIDMIVTCHPNVIFVEKSVSRDIQEILLGKGITLVLDMKLLRMERIARSTGSQIFAIGDTILKSDLKHCEYFHIEKFVEEHNSVVEGVKRPAKTLMFIEGCPKPLDCTILLNGSNSEELKKIKRALQCTVFTAYSLILETSFFADQKTFFFNMNSAREVNVVSPAEMVSSFNLDAMNISNLSHGKNSLAVVPSADDIEIPISDASITDSINDPGFKFRESSMDSSMLIESSITCCGDNTMHGNIHNIGDSQLYVSDVPASDDLIVGENLSPLSSQFMSSNFGFSENEHDDERSALVSPLETIDHEKHLYEDVHKKSDREFYIDEFIQNAKVQNEDDVESGLEPQSILVLMFRYCMTKQVACEDCHLKRIKFYGNFDLPLGRYLTNILLSQKLTCSSCGQPTEAHIYRYTHQNGNLTATVKTLPKESVLPGEAEGKIWMWISCLKCERAKGHPKVTRRVMMSSLARALSFGKFLDISFSNRSAANRLSKCGHLLHRDCLRFFGFGYKVAMFRYSPIEIYAACKPEPTLEFYKQNGQEWVCKKQRKFLQRQSIFSVRSRTF
ncbi:hypothetical protein HPP92_006614 [Vanilla planifolia]|uniref:1-phosphatidylinositol-3-phosphate 5-kinase n=1 Tax=Vanilla planifolia TaxID=51239 RepID=A0A835RIQ7_VANPL|nr:hypothetical protein HPP92_006878 [Vanilla planifolia]KAG0489751.1 hypothetical protein HPP92_006614 [Vanilla planifolia]